MVFILSSFSFCRRRHHRRRCCFCYFPVFFFFRLLMFDRLALPLRLLICFFARSSKRILWVTHFLLNLKLWTCLWIHFIRFVSFIGTFFHIQLSKFLEYALTYTDTQKKNKELCRQFRMKTWLMKSLKMKLLY